MRTAIRERLALLGGRLGDLLALSLVGSLRLVLVGAWYEVGG